MLIDKEQVIKQFPEAKISNASGHIEYVVHCRKFHKKGGKYKLSINSETGAFMCNDCGWKGNALQEFFDEGSQFFAGMKIYRKTDIAESTSSFRSYNHIEWRDGIPSPGKLKPILSLDPGHPAINYLKNRGVTDKDCEAYDIKYCSHGYYNFCSKMGTTSGRIIFPIYMCSKLVGWQARQIDRNGQDREVWHGDEIGWWKPKKVKLSDGKITYSDYEVPKYYTCPGMHRSRSLLNFDYAIKDSDMVVVVEGPIDCIKVGERSVATFGKKITKDQIRILKSNWSKILMILDEEVDISEPWFKELENSFDGVYFVWMKLSNFEDPGSASREEIWKQIKQNTENDYGAKIS